MHGKFMKMDYTKIRLNEVEEEEEEEDGRWRIEEGKGWRQRRMRKEAVVFIEFENMRSSYCSNFIFLCCSLPVFDLS